MHLADSRIYRPLTQPCSGHVVFAFKGSGCQIPPELIRDRVAISEAWVALMSAGGETYLSKGESKKSSKGLNFVANINAAGAHVSSWCTLRSASFSD